MIDRRRFLGASALATASVALWPLRAFAHHQYLAALSQETRSALDQSDLVYVSPLRSNGEESSCHGEVWYGWLDGAAVVITSAQTWKVRALERGLDGARIWVGDHGRWKRMLGRNEEFRKAPHFDAVASSVRDDALLDRLLALYEQKYPDEIGSWRDKMRSGYSDGSRRLIRYAPART